MSEHLPLHPWCIIRLLPNMRSKLIIRFRRRSDAEAYQRILKANNPVASYAIIFDTPPKPNPSAEAAIL